MRQMRVVAAAVLLAGCSSALAQDAGSRLAQRITNARPGEVIRVQPGDYGIVGVKNVAHKGRVRIEAEGASFTGIVLDHVSNIEWNGGKIVGPGGRSYGISIRNADHVTISNMAISGAHRGIVVASSADIALVGNTLTALISDGIDVALSRRVRVERNSCSNFNPTPAIFENGVRIKDGDHPDCIQSWSQPTALPNADIAIIDNRIEGQMQGIFLGNHIRGGVDDGGFDRAIIRGNRIRIGFGNGIVIGGARNSVVRDNIVETTPGAMLPNKPIRVKAVIRVEGTDNLVCGNRVTAVPAGFGTERCPDGK